MKTTWYHGTSTEQGICAGDILDPSRGSFEPCVYVTSTRAQALTYAKAAAALGGKPEVWAVDVEASHVETDLDPQTRKEYEAIRDSGVDVILFDAAGEGGVPMMALLTRCATFREVV